MKIVVVGGTGLIGSKTVARLRQQGHDVVAAAPNTGVNTISGTVEIGGPDKSPLADLVRVFPELVGDRRKVISDPWAPYFNAVLKTDSLVAGPDAHLGKLGFHAWLVQSQKTRHAAVV